MHREAGRTSGVVSTVALSTDGVLNVKKERGCTSHDVVARLRHMVGGVKVGHAGTLDPEATGVLPVLVGKATRVAEYLAQWDKEYRAVLRLGESTDTQDATGTVLVTQPVGTVTEQMVQEVVARFVGQLQQIPPMYSAIKIAGVPLYKTARAGRTIEREARPITIHRIDVLGIDGRDVSLRVACSKGTYIRTLCADLGEALGFGGHMVALERERVGPLSLDDSRTIEEVGVLLAHGRLGQALLSIDEVLGDMPWLEVRAGDAVGAAHGVPIPVSAIVDVGVPGITDLAEGRIIRLKDGAGRLLGLGIIPPGGLSGDVGGDRFGRAVRVVKVFVETE